MKQLNPNDAPKDGTVILANVGYPYLIPAVWCEYGEEWMLAMPQASEMKGGSHELWWENESEKHKGLKGWLPIPRISNDEISTSYCGNCGVESEYRLNGVGMHICCVCNYDITPESEM